MKSNLFSSQITTVLIAFVLAGFSVPTFAASIITHAGTNWLSSSNNTNAGVTFNVSVEGSYAGYKGEYDDGGGAPGAESSGAFNGPVEAYRFWYLPTSTTIGTLTQLGSIIGDVNTTDNNFQNASFLHLWETTPSNGNAFDTTPDYPSGTGTSINNLDQGASGTIDISNLSAGSVYFIYGAYRSTPTFNVSMGSIDLGNLHNGDFANNNEFYIAQVDFVNEGDQSTIDWELPAGFNGRWSGIVVTTTIPEPSSLALLGLAGVGLCFRKRRK